MIESLENRIAPASLAGNVLTYTDIDGDLVKITFSHASMLPGDFTFSTGSVDGTTTAPQSLTTLTLSGHEGAGFVLKASPQSGRGDGHANIGSIQSVNTDLGSISIDGDLGSGHFTSTDFAKASVKSLSVLSVGKANANSGAKLDITGLGSLNVKTDVGNAEVMLENSGVTTSSIHIGGDLLGTGSFSSGSIIDQGSVTTVIVGGSVIGGLDISSGELSLTGLGLHKLAIGGSIRGGAGEFAGSVSVASNAKTVITVGGDIVGNGSASTGHNGQLAIGDAASVKIGGSIIGSTISNTGLFLANGNVGTLSIGHSVIGADNPGSSALTQSGFVAVQGNVGTLTVNGVLLAGRQLSSGKLSQDGEIGVGGVIGKATIGSIVGDEGNLAYLVAGGNGTTGAVSAIKSLTVKHSAVSASILAGYDANFTAQNVNAGFGSINIGGDLSGSFITAGGNKGSDGIPGNTDDSNLSTSAKIVSIKVGGEIEGQPDESATTFYIFSGTIEKVQVGRVVYDHAAFLAPGVSFRAIGNAEIECAV